MARTKTHSDGTIRIVILTDTDTGKIYLMDEDIDIEVFCLIHLIKNKKLTFGGMVYTRDYISRQLEFS